MSRVKVKPLSPKTDKCQSFLLKRYFQERKSQHSFSGNFACDK